LCGIYNILKRTDRLDINAMAIRATYVDTPFVQVSFEQSERVIGAVICQASFCSFHTPPAGMD